jgi:hypothetical protein
MTAPDTTSLVQALRLHSDHRMDGQNRAAIELLIHHHSGGSEAFWLHHDGFRQAALRHDRAAGTAWIDWNAARSAYDDGLGADTSRTERGMLDFAIALGQDRYRWNRVSDDNSAVIVEAVCTALGLPYQPTLDVTP